MTSLHVEKILDEFHGKYSSKDLCDMAFHISRVAPRKRTEDQKNSLASIHRVLEDRHNLRDTMDRFSATNQPWNNWTEILIGAIPKKDRS